MKKFNINFQFPLDIELGGNPWLHIDNVGITLDRRAYSYTRNDVTFPVVGPFSWEEIAGLRESIGGTHSISSFCIVLRDSYDLEKNHAHFYQGNYLEIRRDDMITSNINYENLRDFLKAEVQKRQKGEVVEIPKFQILPGTNTKDGGLGCLVFFFIFLALVVGLLLIVFALSKLGINL